MNANTLALLIVLGGVCHFGILFASALVPRVLDWKAELARVSPLSRHVIWTHGAFIVLTIVAFGAISVANAPALAAGSALARWFCGFVGVFWLSRLVVQLFFFDARPYLTNALLKLGYHGLTVVFAYLGFVYGWAAVAAAPGAAH
jgi:hypothetical protein